MAALHRLPAAYVAIARTARTFERSGKVGEKGTVYGVQRAVEHGRINLRSRGARTDGRFALDDAVSRNGRIRERLPLLGGGRHVRHAVAPGELEDVAVG